MKHLLTAALALALTGAAATAVADPPDKKHDSHPAASGAESTTSDASGTVGFDVV